MPAPPEVAALDADADAEAEPEGLTEPEAAGAPLDAEAEPEAAGAPEEEAAVLLPPAAAFWTNLSNVLSAVGLTAKTMPFWQCLPCAQ